MTARWTGPAAWTLILLVTGFWLWFGIASAAGESLGSGNWLAHLLVPGGLFVATAAVAWRWRLAGASLLILEGLVIAVGYPLLFGSRFPIATVVMVLMTMAAPLLAAGILLIADGGRPPARA